MDENSNVDDKLFWKIDESLRYRWSTIRQMHENFGRLLIIVSTGGIFVCIALATCFFSVRHDEYVYKVVLVPLLLFETSLVLSGIALFKDLYESFKIAKEIQENGENIAQNSISPEGCEQVLSEIRKPIPIFRGLFIISSGCLLLAIAIGTILLVVCL